MDGPGLQSKAVVNPKSINSRQGALRFAPRLCSLSDHWRDKVRYLLQRFLRVRPTDLCQIDWALHIAKLDKDSSLAN